MNNELENQLYEKYSILFDNRHKSPAESCMAFGIECGDGWYDLLSAVCWQIYQREQNIKNRLKYEGKDENTWIPVRFDQIKEKFGGLRIYYSGGDDYVRGTISMAEEMSYKICEVCGNKGKPNKSGWITTLCDNCRKT
jgi:hypothetical protein